MHGGETCKDKRERISLVYYTRVHCERVKFKVTVINLMTGFIARREAACILARVTTKLPRYLHGNSTFYAPFGMHQSYSC